MTTDQQGNIIYNCQTCGTPTPYGLPRARSSLLFCKTQCEQGYFGYL